MKKSPKSQKNPFSSKRQKQSLAFLAILAAAVPAVNAATITWDGGTSGIGTDWGTAADWQRDTLPGPGDTIQFNPRDYSGSGSTKSNTDSYLVTGIDVSTLQVGQTITGGNLPAGTVITAIINNSTVQVSNMPTTVGAGSIKVLNAGGIAAYEVISLGGDQTVANITLNGSPIFTIGSAADVTAGYTFTMTNLVRQSYNSNALTIATNVKLAPDVTGKSTWNADANSGNGVTTIAGAVSSVGDVIVNNIGGGLTMNGANTFTGSVQVLGGTLTLGGTNAYTGTSTASGGTLAVKFNSSTAKDTINSASGLVMGGIKNGGTLTVTGNNTASSVNSQTFNGLTLNYGASTLNIVNGVSSGKTLVSLGSITHNRGGTVNFVQPTINTTIGAQNGYTTTTQNDASGILGAWATVAGTDWAYNDGTNIRAYTGYTDLATSADLTDTTKNARVSAGSTWDISAGSVDMNTLLVKDTVARTVTIGAGNTLRFGAAGGILTPAGAGTLTLGSDSAGTITAGGADNTAGELVINNATAININSTIADNGTGAVALTKAGTGTLTLNAASTNTGGTTVTGGILTFAGTGGVNQLSTTGDIIVSGGTLNFGTTGSQTTSGAVVLSAGAITSGTLTKNEGNFDVRNGTISTRLTGAAGLNKTTSNTVILSGLNYYTGLTTVREGVLSIAATGRTSSDIVIGSPDGSTIAKLDTVSGSNLNTKNVTVYTNSTFNLGNGVHANNVYITGGTFANSYGYVDGIIYMTGGTSTGGLYGNQNSWVTNASPRTSVIGGLKSGANTSFAVADGSAAVDLRLTTGLSGAYNLTKTGSGLMSIEASNSYTGTTTVSGGTLRLDFSASVAPATNLLSAGATASALSLSNSVLDLVGKDSTANSQRFSGLTIGAGYSQITANSATGGSMSLDLGSTLTRSATGVVNFAMPSNGGINTTATTFTPNGVMVSGSPTGAAFATVNGTDWATVSGSSIVAVSSYDVNDFSTAAKNVDVTTDQTPTAFTVNTLRFNTANTTLTLADSNIVSTGGILVTGTGTGVTITSGTIQAGAANELVVISNGDLNIASTIAGSAKTLVLAGSGTTTLSGDNSYKDTNLDSGTVIAANANAFGTTGNVYLYGGTLASASALTISRPVYMNGDATIGGSNDLTLSGFFGGGNNAARILTVNNTGTTTLSGTTELSTSGAAGILTVNGTGNVVISGPVWGTTSAYGASNLVYNGSATLTLSNAANGYSGSTSVLSGTVSVTTLKNEATIGSSVTTSGSNTLILSASALADLQAAGVGVGSGIRGTGIPADTTIMDITGNTVTISQAATGTGTNNLTYGPTNVSSIGQSTTASSNLVIDGGTFQYTGAAASTNRSFSVGNSGTSTLDASGSGAINFTNTGAIGFNNVQGERTLNLAGTNTDDNTLAAAISDSALDTTNLMKSGAGTWVLSGANTYTGATTVNAGSLIVTGSLSAASITTIKDGAVLAGTGLLGSVSVTAATSGITAGGAVDPGVGAASVAANGTVTPNNVIGKLTFGSFNLATGTHLALQASGAGVDAADQIITNGAVTLGGDAQISLILGYTPEAGDRLYLILNGSTTATTGVFSNINGQTATDGSTITINGFQWSLSYFANGDTGTINNDVMLTAMAVPEPATWAFMVGGLGLLAFIKRARRNIA